MKYRSRSRPHSTCSKVMQWEIIMQVLRLTAITAAEQLIVFLFLQILFCYERGFMLSLSDNNQPDAIEAFNSTLRYTDDLLNNNNPYFEQMVGQICPTELQLFPFLLLDLSVMNGIV